MKGVIIVSSEDRRQVYNIDHGWVDRDCGPGPTVFREDQQAGTDLPVDAEWESWNDAT